MMKPVRFSFMRTLVLVLLAVATAVFPSEAQASPKPKSKKKVVARGKTAARGRKQPVYRKTGYRAAPATVNAATVPNTTLPRSQAAFSFANRWHDFGDIVQGEKVTHTFSFKNTGKDPLIVTAVQPTCGCTVTEWTRQPIQPGQSGEISVTFDSKNALNQQNKTVTVISNAAVGSERLYLRGNVLPKR
jgi:hypothetical protein